MAVSIRGIWQRTSVRFVLLLAVFAAGTVATVRLFERMLLSEVQTVTEAANVAITRVFVNEAWSELRPLLDLEAKVHPRDNPNLREVDARVRQFAKGTDLVKVKIYNTKGLTVYSSDPAQLGEDKTNNAGFQTALRGRVASETNYRGKFGAFDGELFQRNLVSSYVPVRGMQGVEAVAELYNDRTTSIEGVDAKTRTAWAYLSGGMAVGFVLVWLLVQAGRAKPADQLEREARAAAEATARQAEAEAQAGILGQAVQALRADADPVARALHAHADTPPDESAWRALRAPLGGLVDHIEQLVLVQAPDAVATQAGASEPLGTAFDATLAAFRERRAGRHLEFSAHVAPALSGRTLPSAPPVLRLVRLLLSDAARRTGEGQIRLNVQPSGKDAVQIEVIGARTQAAQKSAPSAFEASLALSAAQVLARALHGRVDHASSTERGPWFTVTLPIGA